MDGLMKRQYRYSIYAIAVVLVLALTCAFQFRTSPNTMGLPEVDTLNDGWAWRDAGGNWNPLERLPCAVTARDSAIVLRHSLAGVTLSERDTLLFRTRYASLRAWADGELIYEGAMGREHALGKLLHFVSLKGHTDARELVVELRHYDGEPSWVLTQVLVDEPAALRTWLMRQMLPQILFAVITFFVALLLIGVGVSMAVRRLDTWVTMVALAALFLLSGIWLLLDSRVPNLWGGNYALCYFLGYAAYHLILVPYLMLFHLMTQRKYRWPVVLTWVVFACAVLCFTFHLQGLISLRYSSVIVTAEVLAATVLGGRCYYAMSRQQSQKLRWVFMGGFFTNAAGLLASGIHFADEIWSTTGYHHQIIAAVYGAGLLTLLIGTVVDAMKVVGDVIQLQASADHLTMLATRDSMTQLFNRNMYHTDMDSVVRDSPEQVAVAVFDMDGLKAINDKFGHHVGDQAIYMAAHYLQERFKDVGKCYRVGGDEFCAVVVGRQAVRAMGPAMEAVEAWAGTCSAADGAPVSLSQGCAIWQQVDHPLTRRDLQNLMDKADARMYRYKQARKRGRDTLVQK